MDPHKRSATIEVMAGDETVLGGGRFGTDAAGYRAMLGYATQFPERTWAIEGCQGIGRHLAERLVGDGEQVIDVPPKRIALHLWPIPLHLEVESESLPGAMCEPPGRSSICLNTAATTERRTVTCPAEPAPQRCGPRCGAESSRLPNAHVPQWPRARLRRSPSL